VYCISIKIEATTIQVFENNIKIPDKYKLVVKASVNKNKLVFRTGDFFNGPENGLLEIITIGLTKNFLVNNNVSNINEIGKVKKTDKSFNILKPDDKCIKIEAHCYINRVYFDEDFYISYFVVNAVDIDILFK
jgi:hypothetical protein